MPPGLTLAIQAGGSSFAGQLDVPHPIGVGLSMMFFDADGNPLPFAAPGGEDAADRDTQPSGGTGPMSWAHVQGSGLQATGSVTSLAITLTGVGAGNLLASALAWNSCAGTPSVSDNASDTWLIDTTTTANFQ